MSTIPASAIVRVTPGVISAGGSALDLIGLILTENAQVPIGAVQSFSNATDVEDYFGANSAEAAAADIYFNGFDNSNVKPASVLFAQYPAVAVAAYLRGGDVSGLTLTQLKAISGTLTVVMDGYTHVGSSVNLSAATSFSSAASIISAAFTDPTEASFTGSVGASFTGTGSGTNLTTTAVTGYISAGDNVSGTGVPANTHIVSQTSGTPGGAGVYVTNNVTTSSGNALTSTSNVVDVTVCASPTISVGQTLAGGSITGTPIITSQISGTSGGVGLYTFSGAQQSSVSGSLTGVATAPVVSYDSVSGGFVITSGITGVPSTAAFATGTTSAAIKLTQATGAVLSQGAAAADPNSFMDGIIAQTQDWVSFMTIFDPDGGSGNTNKQLFAAWTNSKPNRYAYVAWDPDITPTESNTATTSLGYILKQSGSTGTVCIYSPDYTFAAFVCGAGGSIDFTEHNGRITFAFKGQSGLVPDVTTQTAGDNLIDNGYNFYGDYATANDSFRFFYPGTISGPFEWLDSYFNQVWLNNALQLALMLLLTQVKSVPYNAAGYALIRAACLDPINQALNFGAIAVGVPLSAAQAAEVNNAAGVKIDDVLTNQGYYLQILPAIASVRAARQSPPMTLWYMDGGSVQKINLASIEVQ